MNRKKLVIFLLLAGGVFGILSWMRYRNFHTEPFDYNGTVPAVIFLEPEGGMEGSEQLEVVAHSRVTVDGTANAPIFRAGEFDGNIKIDYFCEAGIFLDRDIHCRAELWNRKVYRQFAFPAYILAGEGGRILFSPVSINYYYAGQLPKPIIGLHWKDQEMGEVCAWWVVCGTQDEKEAREAFDVFWKLYRQYLLGVEASSYGCIKSERGLSR